MKRAEISGDSCENKSGHINATNADAALTTPHSERSRGGMAASHFSKSSFDPIARAIYLAEAAAAWNAARLEAIRLREERAGILCEREVEHAAELKAWSERGGTVWPPESPIPCWKSREDPDGVIPLDQQCAACQQRYAAHKRFVKASLSRGARLRVLQRLAANYRTAEARS